MPDSVQWTPTARPRMHALTPTPTLLWTHKCARAQGVKSRFPRWWEVCQRAASGFLSAWASISALEKLLRSQLTILGSYCVCVCVSVLLSIFRLRLRCVCVSRTCCWLGLWKCEPLVWIDYQIVSAVLFPTFYDNKLVAWYESLSRLFKHCNWRF